VPTLRLRFSGRRYHATPWGHHVNEGLVEWPPSPWRLLRALLATGYAKLHWPADGPPPIARTLIEKLAAEPPRYRLPNAVGTHSRHYMPLARFKNGREDTTLVFDTWAQVDDGELAVHWPIELTADETSLLRELAHALGYLGRSESWVEAELTDGDEQPFPVFAGEAADCPGRGWEQVPLLALQSASDYAQWRARALAVALAEAGIDPHKPTLTAKEKKALAKAEQALPKDLIACLQVDTAWLQSLGWSQPPGTRKLFYWRPASCLEAGAPRPRPSARKAPAVSCMLLGLSTSSASRGSLPRIERTLPQGERLHGLLVAQAMRLHGHSQVLSGCDDQRQPLTLPHQHAHLIHLDLDADDHLDHVLVWAPMGLDAEAQAAVRATRRSFMKGGVGELRLTLAGVGELDDLVRLPAPFGAAIEALTSTAGVLRWRSFTPFVPPRHLKPRGRHTLAGQVNAELAARGLPPAIDVHVLDPHQDEQARRARHFKRVRAGGPPPPQDMGFVLELGFAQPVRGPLALGYGCHFGLGVFAAVPD
jgi:CRISPR-associated protein Csb2